MQTALATDTARPEPKPFEKLYRGYLVKYRPQPTPQGRYLAFAVITRDLGWVWTVASDMPDVPSFESRDEAALAGLAAGKRWIDGHR